MQSIYIFDSTPFVHQSMIGVICFCKS
jgi:hypothetical protein